MTRDEFIKAYESGQRDFRRANLSCANLSYANLSGADLSEANLWDANLSEANLWDANLSCANLRYANLSGADLSYANLSGANLSGADLSGADLSYANLSGANLSGANLSGANLSGANLSGAEGLAQQVITPEGALRVYKKLANNTIAVLSIPANAARVNGYGSRKCRAEFAVVLEGAGRSQHDSEFEYAVGATVRADNWNPDPREVCAGGIHFFLTREEAEEY